MPPIENLTSLKYLARAMTEIYGERNEAGIHRYSQRGLSHISKNTWHYRGWYMISPMPAKLSATPATSQGVGRTPSTAHSQVSATLM